MSEGESVLNTGSDFQGEESISCTSCKKRGNLVSCEGFCLICEQYFCRICHKKHSQMKAMKNHIWLSRSEMPVRKIETGVENKESLLEICDKHLDTMIEYFCVSCKKVGCVKCMKENHTQCSGVVYIPDHVKQVKWTRQEYRSHYGYSGGETAEQYLAQPKGKLAQIKRQLPRHKFAVEKYASDTRKQMEKFRQSLLEALDKFEDDVESKIERIGEDDRKMLELVHRKCDFHEAQCDKLTSKIKQCESNNSNCFVLTQKAKEERDQFEDNKVFEYLQGLMKVTKIRFKPEVRFDKYGCVELGDVVEVKELKEYQKAWTEDRKINILTQDEKINSKEVSVNACIVLENGQLLVADQRNNVLRLCKTGVTTDNQGLSLVLDVVELGNRCEDLAQVSDQLIVVTIPQLKRIQDVNHDGEEEISLGDYIEVDEECYGISAIGDILFVGFSKKVTMMNLNGQILKSVSGEVELRFQFDCPISMTCDSERKLVYIADKNEKVVVAMDCDGRIRSVFRDDNLKIPLTLTMGSDGSVLLACDWPFSVKRVSPDFISVEDLRVRDDTWGITCAAYSPVEDRLFFAVSGSRYIFVRDIGLCAQSSH